MFSSILAGLIAGFAGYFLRALDRSGAVVAGLMGAAIVYWGGWTWIWPPVIFLAGSSIVSGLSERIRSESVVEQDRGSRRDAVQVLSNGGVGWILVVLYADFPHSIFFYAYAASFAAAAADTWATEIGTARGGTTWSITSGRPVPPGRSGGVSWAGLTGSVFGALAISLGSIPAMSTENAAMAVILITTAGVVGGLVDSVLGATVQALYRRPDGGLSESPQTENARLIHGRKWITNDTVNVLCTVAGALLAMLLGLSL